MLLTYYPEQLHLTYRLPAYYLHGTYVLRTYYLNDTYILLICYLGGQEETQVWPAHSHLPSTD